MKWNGICTELFDVTNGVKQGGIFSPLLFCIYIDVLFECLRLANIGCFSGNVYVGSVGYADDVCLMAPFCHTVRKMLSVCVDFGQEYNIKFYSSKSQVTACSNVNIVVNDNFNGDIIHIYKSARHLDRDVGDSDYNCKTINKAIDEFYIKTNYVMS